MTTRTRHSVRRHLACAGAVTAIAVGALGATAPGAAAGVRPMRGWTPPVLWHR